ncbi:hypothetical protein HN51_036575 [Arachis hypogaea]|uniref:Glyoxalase/fosfomycin resistance/dioxygenase domain-containing protein n=1 Tax=Arachis hypogaea TaxID=3818 RepID=A0A444ZZD2_ARAHY|nr:hypothetical protein Ahy_B03g064332 [Arachis hypogaea]
MAASFRWILQLHKDVPKAARFYSEGLGFSTNVCTLRWAELQSGPLHLALLHSPNPKYFLIFLMSSFCLIICHLLTISTTSTTWPQLTKSCRCIRATLRFYHLL